MAGVVYANFLRARNMARARVRRWQASMDRTPITKLRGREKKLALMPVVSWRGNATAGGSVCSRRVSES